MVIVGKTSLAVVVVAAAKQAVLILGKTRQRHVEDALLGPSGFCGDGEHLGG